MDAGLPLPRGGASGPPSVGVTTAGLGIGVVGEGVGVGEGIVTDGDGAGFGVSPVVGGGDTGIDGGAAGAGGATGAALSCPQPATVAARVRISFQEAGFTGCSFGRRAGYRPTGSCQLRRDLSFFATSRRVGLVL